MSDKTHETNEQQQQLRENAEAQLKHHEPPTLPSVADDSERLHELHVYQIKLEMQNEELRRTQLALEESRDRYVDLYKFAPVAYLTLNHHGAITEINLRAATLLGVERKKLIHHSFVNYIANKDKDRWHRHFLQTQQQGCSKQYIELSLLHTDGSTLYVHIDCLSIEANDTLPICRMAVTDINARKQTEDSLRENQSYLSSILEGADLMTWACNIQTGHCLFDKRWGQMRNYQLHEIEPHISSWEKSIFPADFARVKKELNTHIAGHTAFFATEYRICTKSKETIWVMGRGKVTQYDSDGHPLRISGVEMNITQRKKMEEQLRIASVAFQTHTAIIITDADKHIKCANQAFTYLSGYTTQEVTGLTPFFLRSGLHDDNFYQKMFTSLDREGCWQGEIWDKRKNGELFPVWLTITTVRDNNDNITHYVGSFTDLTIQKQAEKVLLDARQQLTNQVTNTQAELNEVKEESKKINTALNVLLKRRMTDQNDIQRMLALEMEGMVLPFLNKLKKMAGSNNNQMNLLNMLENNLQQLVHDYGYDTRLSAIYQKLTPTEMQIASMVRQKLSTKLIAATLNISEGTVGLHRKHIRKKLGLNKKDDNLYSYLASLAE